MKFLFRWFDIYRESKKFDPVKNCEVYKMERCSHVDGLLCDMKICSTLEQYRKRDIQCPVCGHYCLGRGGIGCIDKPSLVEGGGNKMDDKHTKTCHEEGITYHEDLGIDEYGFYCERVRVGPIERVFRVNRSLIDNPDDPCDDPGKKRLKYLRKKVAELYEEIKNAMNQVSDEVSGD